MLDPLELAPQMAVSKAAQMLGTDPVASGRTEPGLKL